MVGMSHRELLSIGEFSVRTGLSIPALRHYDEVGLVSPSRRSEGGFRLYSDSDLERLLVIRRMKPLGYGLEEMRRLLEVVDRLPSAGDDELSGLRGELAGETIGELVNDLAAAADGGTLEDPEIVLTRTPLELDEKAWKKLNKLLAKTHEQALAIAAESAARGTDGVFATELGVLHFKRATQD